MSTTSEKLAYLADTKTAIKDAIVAKGVDVPEGTTFRGYANLISGISTGLSDADLARANATPEDVTAGKTFYAGDSELRTGVALSTPISAVESDVKSGKTYYDNNGVLKMGTKPDCGTFISTNTSSRLTIGGAYGSYKDVTFSVPANANLAVIEIEAIGDYDPTMLALVFNIKGTPQKWEGTKMIITHYGSSSASYNSVSNIEILNGGSTLKFRCNALGVSSSVLNVAYVSFYT